MIFQEESPMPTGDSLFCQNPVLGLVEEKIGEQTLKREEKGVTVVHQFGPSILMDLNHKKGQERGASSSTIKVNVISCPVD
jgi:hypothetical protein